MRTENNDDVKKAFLCLNKSLNRVNDVPKKFANRNLI